MDGNQMMTLGMEFQKSFTVVEAYTERAITMKRFLENMFISTNVFKEIRITFSSLGHEIYCNIKSECLRCRAITVYNIH